MIVIFLATPALSAGTRSENLSPQGRLLSAHHTQTGRLDSRCFRGFFGEIKKPRTRTHRVLSRG